MNRYSIILGKPAPPKVFATEYLGSWDVPAKPSSRLHQCTLRRINFPEHQEYQISSLQIEKNFWGDDVVNLQLYDHGQNAFYFLNEHVLISCGSGRELHVLVQNINVEESTEDPYRRIEITGILKPR